MGDIFSTVPQFGNMTSFGTWQLPQFNAMTYGGNQPWQSQQLFDQITRPLNQDAAKYASIGAAYGRATGGFGGGGGGGGNRDTLAGLMTPDWSGAFGQSYATPDMGNWGLQNWSMPSASPFADPASGGGGGWSPFAESGRNPYQSAYAAAPFQNPYSGGAFGGSIPWPSQMGGFGGGGGGGFTPQASNFGALPDTGLFGRYRASQPSPMGAFTNPFGDPGQSGGYNPFMEAGRWTGGGYSDAPAKVPTGTSQMFGGYTGRSPQSYINSNFGSFQTPEFSQGNIVLGDRLRGEGPPQLSPFLTPGVSGFGY